MTGVGTSKRFVFWTGALHVATVWWACEFVRGLLFVSSPSAKDFPLDDMTRAL